MSAPESPAAPLALQLFGPFEAHLHGAPLPRLRTRKGAWLLALLTLRAPAEVERAWLAGLLWPESTEKDALASLRKSLTDLRRALGPEAHRLRSPTARTLALDLTGAEADVVAFDAALARGDSASLAVAVGRYRGPLLEGWAEEWVFQERQVREQAYLAALEKLAEGERERGDAAAAEHYLRRAIAADPTREATQRRLMQTLAGSGNYAGAVQVYRELRERLHRELNAEPDAETRALFEQIRAEARRRAQAPPSVSTVAATRPPATPQPRAVMGEGTLTFLFTDIEGSTRLWETQREGMRTALARHDALLRAVIAASDGDVFKTVGDQFCAAFANAPAAIAAAFAAQRALQQEPWGEVGPLRVRMALYTGLAEERDGDYFGPPLNRVARLLEAGHGGQVLLSQTTADLVRHDLPSEASLRDLGSHRLKDLQQPEHIFHLLHPDLPSDFPPLRSLETFTHNLPAQLTSFIGRERQIAEVKQLLTSARLLTLTGSGGCGKTRLALQVAADLLEAYADGVWLAELAPLAEPALVLNAVASALGVREEPGRPLTASLTDYLRPKSLLLMLDNCEHLLTACATLADTLLRNCPSLRILASSREGLGIDGEQTYRVPSLTLPDARHLPPMQMLHEFEAVQLFTDRARLAQPAFAVTLGNALAVAQVCQRLDGIPLAIELAAARVKALQVETLCERLDDMFRLLTGGSRTALPRQQTLRALIDWSYDLLSPSEKALFRRLSVFAGGWTLEAAEAVCAGEGVEEWELLDLLSSLVAKSLVLYDERGGEGRYRLLEPVRQYARERLLEAHEAVRVRGRHHGWYSGFVERARPELYGEEQGVMLDRLGREHDNLRAALAWSESQEQDEASLRLGAVLHRFWEIRAHVGEGREHLARLLSRPGTQGRTAARADALNAAGRLAFCQGDCGEARALHEESLAISQELKNTFGIARALTGLGNTTSVQGDHEAARMFYERCLTIMQQLENQRGIAVAFANLGRLALRQEDYATARRQYEQCLPIVRKLGDVHFLAASLCDLGEVAHLEGNLETARTLFGESLAIFRELGDKRRLAEVLDAVAVLAVAQPDPARAVRLFGSAELLRDTIGVSGGQMWRVDYERNVAAARSALSEEAFAAAWAEGQAMSAEAAVTYALQEDGPLTAETGTGQGMREE